MKIPRERLAPIIMEWRRQFEARHPGNIRDKTVNESPAYVALGFQAGVSARRVRLVAEGGDEWCRGQRVPFTHVTFAMADKIIGAIDTSIWHNELADLYEEAA